MEQDNKNAIVSIKADEIYQHPDNPRKDLGDLTELVDSIGKNGIMQNLTVIPGHWLTDEEWKAAAAEYKKNPTEGLRMKMNKGWVDEGYTLVIGHRRCAAAKLAGLKELPCRIVADMDKKEQVSVMLEENMQRADLTIWEQANGFQLMLNLGETEGQIAEKSGFSRTTVRRRLNIAKLDQEILKEKEADDSFQLSLKDLYELEKVEDIATRNKILKEATSSRDIVWRAHSAACEAARKKKAEAIILLAEKAGIEKAPEKYANEVYSGKWETVKEYSIDVDPPKALRIPKEEKGGIYYVRYYNSVRLVKKVKKEGSSEAEEELTRKTEAKKKEIMAVLKAMDARKTEFIKSIISGKIDPVKEKEEVKEDVWRVLLDMGIFVSMSSLRHLFTGKPDYNCTPEEKKEADSNIQGLSMEYQMLAAINYTLANAGSVFDWQLRHNADICGKIKRAYAVLKRYGWSFTDEEQAILDGTHVCYVAQEGGKI